MKRKYALYLLLNTVVLIQSVLSVYRPVSENEYIHIYCFLKIRYLTIIDVFLILQQWV